MSKIQIKTEWVKVKVSDGTEMGVYVARPMEKGKHPALFVIQEAFGVNHHIRGVTERFAREGYVCVSPEFFHRTAPHGWEGAYDNFDAIMPHFKALTPEGTKADLTASFEWLIKDPEVDPNRVGSVGYCFGGRTTYLANASLPLKAAVSYYGGGISDMLDLVNSQHAPIILIWGGKDAHITPDKRRAVTDAFTQAGKSFVNVEFADADHGFNCDERKSYNAPAAKQAWALTKEFFEENLKANRA